MRNWRQIGAIVAAAAVAVSGAALHAQTFDHSYAVVIGINDYQYPAKWPHLDYPEKDAKALADFLASQGFAVKPFYGLAARKQAILSYMQDTLAPKLTEHDRVLVFFAGHGHTETLGGRKRGYIVPYDGELSSSLISMEEIQDESGFMGSARHQFFLLDSCFGGLLERPRDSVVDPGIPNYLQNVTDRIARQALTAGGENEQVVDNGPYGHSVFMDALLEGLKDGMADLNGDGYITFNELAAFVVPKASNKFQTPAPGYLPGHELGEFWFRSPKGALREVASIPVAPTAKLRAGDMTKTAEQHVAAGDARWNVKDWDGAAAEYREAIRLEPDYAAAHSDLGAALGKKGDWDGDVNEEREAVRLEPNEARWHRELGEALGWKGNWDAFAKEEQAAIRLNPNDAESHKALGSALAWLGDWDGAIKEDKEAIRLNPNDAKSHRNLGMAVNHKGDSDGAIKELREAIKLDPNDAISHRELGTVLGNKGDGDRKIEEEREAIRLDPNDAVAHDRLGQAFEHKGLLSEAATEYTKATSLDPSSQEYKVDLAGVQTKLKQ
jgi:tetratricopeptide (TPR) repeat protein